MTVLAIGGRQSSRHSYHSRHPKPDSDQDVAVEYYVRWNGNTSDGSTMGDSATSTHARPVDGWWDKATRSCLLGITRGCLLVIMDDRR